MQEINEVVGQADGVRLTRALTALGIADTTGPTVRTANR